MKNLISILFSIAVILLSYACSKEPNDEFNFTFQGKNFHNTSDNIKVEVITLGIDRIYIRMPDVFGGDIYFDINGCAYLAPGFPRTYIGPGCALYRINEEDPPIDSTKVSTYQSGSLDLTISDCKTHTVEDPYGILSYEVTTCKASGTFDLILINQKNETIEITNGVINNFPVEN